MEIRVEQDIIDGLIAMAADAAPLECCGLLLGDVGRIDSLCMARNVHHRPRTHFEIDPQILIDTHRRAREGGPPIAGYYHSHPAGPARPSATDREMSHGDGMIWAIIGQGKVTFWLDTAGGFRSLAVK